ncbi:MAG: MarC family protein [Syntrophorhabdaceae bacterium]|jgi:multiple antibiotic resistance protein|nr:MarC family protein [Syntrophorhabdales bacterium]MBP9561569.1 MarC family protein [Syntrophorhabdaceae bacterium]
MFDTFLLSFIPLFVAFDVLGILPIYIKFTAHLDSIRRKKQLRDSITTSFITTLLFVVIGNHVLRYLGIAIRDFFIAGGVVLFIIAVKDIIIGHVEPVIEDDMFGVVPLGVPLLAGPAVLTTSIIIRNNYGFYFFLASLLANLIICWVLLRFSELILRYLGKKFIEALSKVFALVIASIAVMFIRKGLTG